MFDGRGTWSRVENENNRFMSVNKKKIEGTKNERRMNVILFHKSNFTFTAHTKFEF